jgi:hypothetical protein
MQQVNLIVSFWHWLISNAAQLFDSKDDHALGDELGEYLAEVHPFLGW